MLYKEAAGNAEWKARYFQLLGDKLIYFESDSLPQVSTPTISTTDTVHACTHIMYTSTCTHHMHTHTHHNTTHTHTHTHTHAHIPPQDDKQLGEVLCHRMQRAVPLDKREGYHCFAINMKYETSVVLATTISSVSTTLCVHLSTLDLTKH